MTAPVKPSINKLTALFFSITLILTAVMVYFGNTIFLSQNRLVENFDPPPSSYYAFSQFQVAFERTGHQAIRYAAGLDKTADNLRQHYALLQQKFQTLTEPSLLDNFSQPPPDKHLENLETLNAFMQSIAEDMAKLPDNSRAAKNLAQHFEEMRAPVEEITSTVRHLEHDHYAATAKDFSQLRRSMYVSGLLLWANFSVWVALLLLNVRHSRNLIKQQENAIMAEREAVIAGQNAILTKNTLLGMISHELRTPLQTIISSIDLLTLHTQKKHPPDINVVKRLGEASMQLEAQLKDLMDYARLDAGKLSLRYATVNPSKLIRAAVSNFEELARIKGLQLTVEIEESDIQVFSDAYRIQQIVSNLISNAIKYSEQGEVKIQLEPVQSGASVIMLVVEDTGPGISKEDMSRLFEPFTQIDQSHTRRYDGAGLGLAIVKRLVDLFEGDIQVFSAVGYGTRFEVRLPIGTFAANSTIEASLPLRSVERNPILLVDDNMDVRASLKEIVEQLGYQCESADNGKNALQKITTQRFEAILLDIQMPELDGFAVAAHIRSHQGLNQHTPIIGISAYSHKESSEARLRFFSNYLMKPIRHEKLGAALHETIAAQKYARSQLRISMESSASANMPQPE